MDAELQGDVRGVSGDDRVLNAWSAGTGPTLLLLHGIHAFTLGAAFPPALVARGWHVVAPTLPGFGAAPRPDHVRTVPDLVRTTLDLIDTLPGRIALVGLSFGGWIAAEIAVIYAHRLSALVLVDALGIRIAPRDQPDILHLFNEPPGDVRRAAWHDPAQAPDPDSMDEPARTRHAADRDALCRYAWRPFLHDPALRPWLRRITTPTLVLWGESDRVVTPEYGRAYAAAIPGAAFATIQAAGHHPDIEQPHALAAAADAFLRDHR